MSKSAVTANTGLKSPVKDGSEAGEGMGIREDFLK
jgi:hypothetical protein